MKRLIAQNLRMYRNLAKLTQKQFAEAIGVTNRVVSNWETCINGIDVEMLPAICRVLGVSVDKLLSVDETYSVFSDEALGVARDFDGLTDESKALVRVVIDFESKRSSGERIVQEVVSHLPEQVPYMDQSNSMPNSSSLSKHK